MTRGSLEHTCISCGKPFKVAPSVIAKGGGITCSSTCRREISGYRRQVLAAMPDTMAAIAEASNIELPIVRSNVRRMLAADEAHIKGFVDRGQNTGQGSPRFEPIIDVGPSPDPDMPKSSRAAVTFHMMKMVLAAMPARLQDIITTTQISAHTVQALLKQLRDDKKCHVGDWVRSACGPLEVFVRGAGVDAVCKIKNLTPKEKNLRYSKKLKQEGRWEEKKRRNRAYYWKKKAATRGDAMIGLLFGSAVKRRPQSLEGQ